MARTVGIKGLAKIAVDQLGRLPSSGERQRLSVGFDSFFEPHYCIIIGTATGQRVGSKRRRIPKGKILSAARRSIVVDDLNGAPD